MPRILSSTIVILTCLFAFGQEEGEISKRYERLKARSGYYEGYIVENSGDTISGLIQLKLGPYGSLSNFWFVDKEGKKYFTEPLEVKGFSYNDLQFISKEGSFYYMIYDGDDIRLLRNVTIIYEPSSHKSFFSGVSASAFFRHPRNAVFHINFSGSDEFTLIDKKNFYEILPQLLYSCPSVIDKINQGDYFIYDMEIVARHYDNCKKINE
ncbi:MAG: hypothetical protein Tsb0034_00090 [Ekhidna sp.]